MNESAEKLGVESTAASIGTRSRSRSREKRSVNALFIVQRINNSTDPSYLSLFVPPSFSEFDAEAEMRYGLIKRAIIFARI